MGKSARDIVLIITVYVCYRRGAGAGSGVCRVILNIWPNVQKREGQLQSVHEKRIHACTVSRRPAAKPALARSASRELV